MKVKLPFAEHYNLYPGKNTDGYALCFNAIYACRMQFSLSYNFLLMLHQPLLNKNTGLYHVLGSIEGALINILPICLLVIAGMNLFETCAKLLSKVGIDAARDPDPKNPEHMEQVTEGRHLIARGRRQGGINLSIPSKTKSVIKGDTSKSLLRN